MLWPSHHQAPSPLAKSQQKKKQRATRNYPVIDHGLIEAATLVERNGGLEWDSLVNLKPSEGNKLRILRSINIFPATKPPPLPEPTVTVNQRADQGAHFLRTNFPDVDVTGELIREQVTEDTFRAKELSNFDPFVGDLLDVVRTYGEPSTQTYLAFPMGEVDAELNLSPILTQDDGRLLIRPNTIAVRTFSTPIQQIVSSSAGESSRGTLLGIRTFGSTSLLRFDPNSNSSEGLTDVTYLVSHDIGRTSAMDVKISSAPGPFEVLVANKRGGVYGCSLNNNRKTMVELHTGPNSSSEHQFWRIGLGNKPTECMILSEKVVDQLDFRSNQNIPLYAEPSVDLLTSIEDYGQDTLVRLCSTSQILWLDPRVPGRPLLAHKHRRQYDRTLHTNTLFYSGTPLTFLSSRRNGLLTVYDASLHQDSLIRINNPPYGISPPYGICLPHTGQAFLPHETKAIAIFKIDERADVHCLELRSEDTDEEEIFNSLAVEESELVTELKIRAEDMKTDLERFGDQDKTKKDLFPAYENIFQLHAEQQEKLEAEQADEIYDAIEQLPTFWQTNDTPVDHMLTSYDVAFRAHDGPRVPSRSDFTTGSLVNTTRGFRALSQDKFPTESLRKGVPWHYSLADVYKHIDPDLDLHGDVQDIANSLHEFDLIQDDQRSISSIRRENVAREQLAVDLVLSRDIYSTSAFEKPHEVGNDLETMTEALSLGGDGVNEPPEVVFGYLRPMAKTKNHYDGEPNGEEGEDEKEKERGELSLPMGVRLLLDDWEVGTKVKDHVFKDPYDTTSEPAPRPSIYPAMMGSRIPNMTQSLSQRPPAVISAQTVATGRTMDASIWSSSQPLVNSTMRRPGNVQSQDAVGRLGRMSGAESGTERPQSQSQDGYSESQPMVSTQVLPGPHGGRPCGPKKKAAKKRLGGF